MLAAYARNGHYKAAVELFRRMISVEKLQPSQATYLSVVEACASLRNLELGRGIHQCIVANGAGAGAGLESSIGNALIGMYSKCRSCDEAWKVFGSISNKTVYSWNSMISAFAQHGDHRNALRLYNRMEPEGIPRNLVTFLAALAACSALQDLPEGRRIHSRVLAAGFGSQVVVRNALVNMYSKCGDVEAAREIFDETVDRSEVSWNSIMAAYAQNGRPEETLELYRKMDVQPDCITFTTALDACSKLRVLDQGREIHRQLVSSGLKPDTATGNALVTMYGRCGCLEQARRVFDAMETKDVVTWTAIITAYAQGGDATQALEIYAKMTDPESRIKPNQITLVTVANACCDAKDLVQGRSIHSRAISCKFPLDGSLGNALVNMYASCGSLIEARQLFDVMIDRDVVSWSSMIAAYARHGNAAEALGLLYSLCLEGVEPDNLTFVTILFACSHAGLVAEGRYVFVLMGEYHGGCPDAQHYKCLADVFGRAGWIPQATEIVENMPFEPDSAAWMTLIGSYNISGD